MVRYWLPASLLLALLSMLSGCKKPPPPIVVVVGRVTLGAQPLPGAEVRFYPVIEYGGEYIASGVTDKYGYYSLTCLGQPGACEGENRITITEGPMPEDYRGTSGESQQKAAQFLQSLMNRPIPAQYANLAQSPLSVVVKPDQHTYNLELVR